MLRDEGRCIARVHIYYDISSGSMSIRLNMSAAWVSVHGVGWGQRGNGVIFRIFNSCTCPFHTFSSHLFSLISPFRSICGTSKAS